MTWEELLEHMDNLSLWSPFGCAEQACGNLRRHVQGSPCPGFAVPDATPGVMTWDELLEHTDDLVDWSAEKIKE